MRGHRYPATGAVVALLGGLAALLALRTLRVEPELGYVGWSVPGAAALLVPGLAAIVVALESLRRRPDRCAVLLALAGLASFLPELSIAGARPALAFTAGLVLAWVAPPLVAQLALSHPRGPLSLPTRLLCAAGYLSSILALGLLPALVYDPVEAACGQCSTNLVLLHASPRLESPLARAGIMATLVWAVVAITAILYRLLRATPAARRFSWPVLVPAAALVGCFAAELALSLGRAYLSTDDLGRWLWLGGQAALLGTAFGFATRWLRAWQARVALARDVVELSNRSQADTVAARLSHLLGDSTLEIGYPVGNPTHFVDARGVELTLATEPGREATRLQDEEQKPIAVLWHRDGLLDDSALVEEIARAARLALAHERLRADARARLLLLQASRRRIVAAADAERERLECNLHDGAQQRLVSLAVALRAIQNTNGHESALLDEAQQELACALDDLRLIARGIYPSVLAELGVAAAIEALAETAPLPVKLGELPQERFDATVEATAYFTVVEIVHDPAASRVTISGRRNADTLELVVTTDAPTNDLTRLADRVGAVGGRIRRRALAADGVAIEVEIPCGS
jgi:signal transduction histidine kinase